MKSLGPIVIFCAGIFQWHLPISNIFDACVFNLDLPVLTRFPSLNLSRALRFFWPVCPTRWKWHWFIKRSMQPYKLRGHRLQFENSQIFHATVFDRCCMMLQSFAQARALTMLCPDMHTSSIFNTQHVATRRNRMAKRAQHVAPNIVLICCVKNVAIVWSL